MQVDKNGFPVLLAENGNAVAVEPAPEPDPTETARRNDAIREVARHYKHGDTDGVVKYLEERITRPLTVDELDGFHKDVHQHRVNDLVDIIDHQLRGSGVLTRSYRAVKVSAPSGWVQSMIEALDNDEIIFIARRLKTRGHDLSEVQKFLGKRISKKRFATLEDKLDDEGYELNLNASGLVEGTLNDDGPMPPPPPTPGGENIARPPESYDRMAEAIGRGIAVALKELK